MEKDNEKNIQLIKENRKNDEYNKKLTVQINDLKNKNNILMQKNKKLIEEIKQKDSEIINILNSYQKETDEIKEINLIKNQNIELNGN